MKKIKLFEEFGHPESVWPVPNRHKGSDLLASPEQEENFEAKESSCISTLDSAIDDFCMAVNSCTDFEHEEESEENHDFGHEEREMEIYDRMKEICGELQELMSELKGEEANEDDIEYDEAGNTYSG
jgi:hypothetical protein